MEKIKNKIAESGLVVIDLSSFYPSKPIVEFDLKPLLVNEQIVMEKYFRATLEEIDFSFYNHKIVSVHCSVDTLIPNWAYMLIASHFSKFDTELFMGTAQVVKNKYLLENIKSNLNPEKYTLKNVILKGCGDPSLDSEAYLKASEILLPHVKSLMFGEPCSTVPVFKRK